MNRGRIAPQPQLAFSYAVNPAPPVPSPAYPPPSENVLPALGAASAGVIAPGVPITTAVLLPLTGA